MLPILTVSLRGLKHLQGQAVVGVGEHIRGSVITIAVANHKSCEGVFFLTSLI
jgi:hypothetical protein